jgi:hypothetical protein
MEMRLSNLIGLILGMAFTAIGLWWAPIIFRCRLSDFFPILLPPDSSLENWLCFHCDDCAVDLAGMLWLLGYFVPVFLVSGATASRVGAKQSPTRGAVAVGLVSGAVLLHLATSTEAVDILKTALVGVSVLFVSIVCSYGAGYFVTRNA